MNLTFPTRLPAGDLERYVDLGQSGDSAARDAAIGELSLIALRCLSRLIGIRYADVREDLESAVVANVVRVFPLLQTRDRDGNPRKVSGYVWRCTLNCVYQELAGLKLLRSQSVPLEDWGHPVVDTCEDVDDQDMVKVLASALARLSTRERSILTRHYGLDGGEPLSFAAIAKEQGVSRARIHIINRRACRRLRQAMERSA